MAGSLRRLRGEGSSASTYVRDGDGKRRRVERSSDKSPEDARRLLQRHLVARRTPLSDQLVTERTTLAELFKIWLAAKSFEDGILEQTVGQYRQVWSKHGADQLGGRCGYPSCRHRGRMRIFRLLLSTRPRRPHICESILRGMFSMAVRFDVLAVNPISETKTTKVDRKPARALTPAEFERVRAAVMAYATRKASAVRSRGGCSRPSWRCLPRPAADQTKFWRCAGQMSICSPPPTVTFYRGTLVDHQRVEGKPLHRQDKRKAGAPPHTVSLPKFGVEAFTALLGETGPDGPVFASRDRRVDEFGEHAAGAAHGAPGRSGGG